VAKVKTFSGTRFEAIFKAFVIALFVVPTGQPNPSKTEGIPFFKRQNLLERVLVRNVVRLR